MPKLAPNPQAERVHLLRTTVRRIEALLPAISCDQTNNERKLLKILGKLRRRAGRVRDLDVQVAALSTLKLGREESRKARLMNDLAGLRSKRGKKLVRALDGDTLRELRKRIRRTAQHVTQAVREGNPEARSENSAGGARPTRPQADDDPVVTALRMFAQLSREQGPLTETTLHQYRLRSKRIRYIAELAGETPRSKEVVGHLKRLQDAVGTWHDWDTLSLRAEKAFGDLHNSALTAALRNVTRAKFAEALRISADAKRQLLALDRAQQAGRHGTSKAPPPPAPRGVVRPRSSGATAAA